MAFYKLKDNFANFVRKSGTAIGLIPEAQLVGRYVDDHPSNEDIHTGEVVLVGTPTFTKWALLKCPGGCDEVISLYLGKQRRPRWTAEKDWFNRVTVHPSVRQTGECRCHFWIKNGQVQWCADTPKEILQNVKKQGNNLV